MKTEELTALGLTEDQAAKVFAMHGKELTAEQKKTQKAIEERDDLKVRLETAETTLKSFEGIDPEKIQGELAGWKKKAEDAEKDFKAQLTRRDQQDWLKGKLDEYGVKSPYSDSQMEARGVVQIPLCFLAKSLENMSLCHAAYFCRGWENARGCRIEHEAAKAYGLDIIYED